MLKKEWVIVRTLSTKISVYTFSRLHSTLDEARAEAERLCLKEGVEFLILEVVGKCGPGAVRWEE